MRSFALGDRDGFSTDLVFPLHFPSCVVELCSFSCTSKEKKSTEQSGSSSINSSHQECLGEQSLGVGVDRGGWESG